LATVEPPDGLLNNPVRYRAKAIATGWGDLSKDK